MIVWDAEVSGEGGRDGGREWVSVTAVQRNGTVDIISLPDSLFINQLPVYK